MKHEKTEVLQFIMNKQICNWTAEHCLRLSVILIHSFGNTMFDSIKDLLTVNEGSGLSCIIQTLMPYQADEGK